MKFFRTEQIRHIDAATIEREPIASIDLMERAAARLHSAIMDHFGRQGYTFALFAGPGNNGGDALAVARMLHAAGEAVAVWLVAPTGRLSADCKCNLERLKSIGIPVTECNDEFAAPSLPAQCVIIDGLFGSGLNKPLDGLFARVVDFINSTPATVVAIDIPSGLPGEAVITPSSKVVNADITLTLQFPKLSLMMPENEKAVGHWQVLDISLDATAIAECDTPYRYTVASDIKPFVRPRSRFSHKGNYGRALLVAGSLGMAGASILAARAALRSGAGLLTVCTPWVNNAMVQCAVPEATTLPHHGKEHLCSVPDTAPYSAIAIGPGLGTNEATANALLEMLEQSKAPMVLDADALNIISSHKGWIEKIPAGTIITPHPGEFARLTGKHTDRMEQIALATDMATRLGIVVVLKGAYTVVCTPDGRQHFNSSGNPGMATGGSGDVLTGITLALLAQGYPPTEAALMAVYIHGLAGDVAASEHGYTATTAGDIVNALPSAWKTMEVPHAR